MTYGVARIGMVQKNTPPCHVRPIGATAISFNVASMGR